MSLEVGTGGEDFERLRLLHEIETRMLLRGRATRTIYLNGGSDTRRCVRGYWHEWAESLGLKCESHGWGVVIGRHVRA